MERSNVKSESGNLQFGDFNEDEVHFFTSSSKKWGEIVESEEEISEIVFEEKVDFLHEKCCPQISEGEDFNLTYNELLSIFQDNYSDFIKNKDLKVDCSFNVLRNSTYHMLKLGIEKEINDDKKMNLLHYYLKFRHDFLSLKASKILKINEEKTDISFKEVFGISSDRTPDFIFKIDDFYNIIEVSAVTDVERGAMSKGDLEYGYKSKYDRELMELEKMGIKVNYHVVIFDVKDKENDDFKEKITNILKICNFEDPDKMDLNDLDFFRKEFCNSTKNISDVFGEFYSNLFEEKFELAEYHSNNTVDEIFEKGGKSFTGHYKSVGVSMGVYETVRRNLPRLEDKSFRLIKKSPGNDDEEEWVLNLDLNKSNLYFSVKKVQKHSGLKISEWYDIISKKRCDLICEKLNTIISGVDTSMPRSDFEYFQYVKKEEQNYKKFEYFDSENKHRSSFNPSTSKVEIMDFKDKLNDKSFKSMCSKYEDEDYEEKIFDYLEEGMDEKGLKGNFIKKPFSECVLDEKMIDNAISIFEKEYLKINLSEDKILHSKQPFLLPLYKVNEDSYGDIKEKPKKLNFLLDKSLGPFTNRIISVINSENFEFGTKKDEREIVSPERKELAEIQRKINDELKEMFRKSDRKQQFKLKDLPDSEKYRQQLSKLNSDIRKKYKNNKNILCLVRFSGKNKDIKKDFNEEMEHFRPKKSGKIYKGVSCKPNFDLIEKNIFLLNEQMSSPSGVKFQDDFIDTFVDKDVELLMEMKKFAIEKYENFFKWVRGSNFYHSCEFISRFCHSLLFHSQTSINSDYVSVDNLGYKDCLLLVKGGKKIFPTKRSKLFRLIIPTYESCLDLYKVSDLPSSFTFFEEEGVNYLVTPWMNLHETILCDGLTTLHRNIGFLCLNSEYFENNLDNFNNCFFNMILFFHNRRQTETFLHNMRYIMMNSLSDFTAMDEILQEMAGFNYDSLQFYIRECVIRKFKDFAMKLKSYHDKSKSVKISDSLKKGELINMFTNRPIKDLNQLSTSVYITYMMSKAPTTQTLEQVSNLKSMMETHEDFMKLGTNINDGKIYKTLEKEKDLTGYYNSLMENDFNFDPKYCVLLGKFMGDYLQKLIGEGEMHKKWSKIIGKSWDEFSNTKGLRGDNDKDFFGSKGYYVVYKSILDKNPNLISELETLLNTDPSDKIFSKKLKELNETYRFKVKDENLETIILHVVDKKQRSGKREIFVMDRKTKIYQQIIENYVGEICKSIPNEVISVPSNKRLSTIHSRVFESQKTDQENYYMVMDCRKWAPKSIVQKFILFLSGMRKVLPATFLKHCYNFFDLLVKKRVYTKPHIVGFFEKNDELKRNRKNFEEDKERGGFFYEMPYSWMMGIFNYFSSFMHVANQMHISHLCRIHFDKVLEEEANLHMIAHSDDSAGKVSVNSKKSMKRVLLIYEIFMKAANHLISKKKSNCGKAYYEFISILYIDGNLLSLVIKFAGLFNFHPTDKGYSADINEAYSKCIELILNGSTLSQAYIGLKIQSHLIRRFYFNKKQEKKLYRFPPKMMGIPDSHPLMVLLCGSESDTLRIKLTSSEEEMKVIYFLNEELSTGESQVEGFLKSFDCTPNVRLRKDLKNLQEKFDTSIFQDNWTIKNVKFNNTALNTIQFLMKLKDKTFIAALQDESLTRRLSRAFFYRSNRVLNTKYGQIKYEDFVEVMMLFMSKIESVKFEITKNNEPIIRNLESVMENDYKNFDLEKTNSLFNCLFCEPMKLCNYMSNIRFKKENIKPSQKTTKPLHIKILNTTEKLPFKVQTQSLSSWIKFPEERHLLPDTRNMHTVEKFFKDFLESFNLNSKDLSVEEINGLLMRMEKKNETEYFCYSNVPSQMREVNTYQDVLNYLAHNTLRNKYVEGLTVKFGKTISVSTKNVVDCLAGDDVDWTLSFCVLISILSKSEDFENFRRLELKSPGFLGSKNSPAEEIFKELEIYWRKNMEVFRYINLELLKSRKLCLKEEIDSESLDKVYFNSFLKSQYLFKNTWMGVGQLYINLVDLKLNFTIKNNKMIRVYANTFGYDLVSHEIDYINLCFKNAQMGFLSENMRFVEPQEKNDYFLGIDENFYYKICKGFEILKGINLSMDYNVQTYLSNPKTGRIFVNERGKMRWIKKEEHAEYNYKIESIPVEIFNSVKLLGNLVPDTFKNKMVLRGVKPEFKKELFDYCVRKLSIELEVGKEEILADYRSTQVFKILNFCKNKRLCRVAPREIRKKDFPAQEGGLLNALINYSQENKNFDFDWDKTMSPAYIRMKATQPEAFMAMLVKNVEKNYNDLYDSEDKTVILRNLINVSKLPDENFDEKMLEVLCNWSYAGVIGSLSTLKKEIKAENFRSIRFFKKDFPFIKLFESLLEDFLKIFFSATNFYLNKIGEIFSDLEGWENFVINNKNYRRIYSSIIHLNVLPKYGGKNSPPTYFEKIDLAVYTMMKSILSNEESKNFLKKELSENFIFSGLPVEIEFLNEWFMVYNSIRSMYRRVQIGTFLDLNKRVERFENFSPPFIITRDFLKKVGLSVKPKNLIYHGIFEEEFYTHFKEKKFGVMDKQILRVNFKIVDINKVDKVNFTRNYFPPHVFTEDFLDSEEYEEIDFELSSNETDLDYVEKNIKKYKGEVFEKNPSKLMKAVYKGKMVNVLSFEASVIIDVSPNKKNIIDRIRQSGQHVLMITDRLLSLDPNFYKDVGATVYAFKDDYWGERKAFLNKGELFAIVFSYFKTESFWEEVLHAKSISFESIKSLRKIPIGIYYNELGILEDNSKLMERTTIEAMEILQKNYDEKKKIEEEANEKREIVLDEIKDKMEKLIEKGYDKDFLEKYVNAVEEKTYGWEQIHNCLEEIIKNEKIFGALIGRIESKTEELIKVNKDPKIYEYIFQIPKMLGISREKMMNQKNLSLKEPRIIAEIEAIFPGFSSKILSDTLKISEKMRKRFERRCRNLRKVSTHLRRNKEGKSFILNFIMLVANDAQTFEENTEDEDEDVWLDVLDWLDNKFDEEEENSEDPEENIGLGEEGNAVLKYSPKQFEFEFDF